MHIRLATPDDLPGILDLSNHYARTTAANFAVEPESLDLWRESFRTTSATFPWLVAVELAAPTPLPTGAGSHVLGFAKASPWKGRSAYTWTAEVTVYVDPAHHRQGVGRALYKRLIGILRAQGYRTLLGGITQPNDASVRLHESLGFRRVAMLERVGFKFGRWHDVGYWELMLGESDAPPQPVHPVADAVNAIGSSQLSSCHANGHNPAE